MFILDTNVISAMIRDPAGPASRKAHETDPEQLATSVVVAGEMRFGYLRKDAPALKAKVEAALSALIVLPIEVDVSCHYGSIRLELERAGTPIGSNDLWIAAHARALGATLVTNNIRELSRVPELKLEDWTALP